MKKAILLILPILLLFLAGCPGGSPPPVNNSTTQVRVSISPVSITEDRETIITGDTTINGTNTTFNKTVPDYTYSPNQTTFIYFMNFTYISDWSDNASNERQGDAILIKKGDADILIDAGSAEHGTDLVNYLRERGVDDIELLVSTHARPESYGGMNAVLDNIEVEQFMWTGDDGGDQAYAALVQKAQSKARKTIIASYLYNFSINGIDFLVLNPRVGNDKLFSIDSDGIVFKIQDRGFCLMTTGDIAYGAQTKIADASDYDPKCKVLQVPNNGLGTGSTQIDLFLLKVAPQAAIVTGSYFDPANERYSIYEKLNLRNIKYFTTFSSAKKATNVVRITVDEAGYTIFSQPGINYTVKN